MKTSSFGAWFATFAAGALLWVAAPAPANAQSTGGFALNPLDAPPAGDAFFGVASAGAPGHLTPRAYVMFDYLGSPIHLSQSSNDVVSAQAYLRADVSISLWERVLVSAHLPLAIIQSEEDPGLMGFSFTPLDAPAVGDMRLGARARIWGEDGGPFQIAAGASLVLPTGDPAQYTGDGAVGGGPALSLGGQMGRGFGFLWSAAASLRFNGSDNPNLFNAGLGAGLLLLDRKLQIGPELLASIPFGGTRILSATPTTPVDASAIIELTAGAKLRILDGLTIGFAGGPGLTSSVGTPAFRLMGFVGWTPLPSPKSETAPVKEALQDKDNDGIADNLDACPDVKGEPSPDPSKDGCPPADRDGDSILDAEDACPQFKGPRNLDVTKNGCPDDTDGDGIHDGLDACVNVSGIANNNPKKNGCPLDSDDDGIADTSDACPSEAGSASSDPKYNGCVADPDGDGIQFGADACPKEKGSADPDPKQNGCPKFVRVTKDEIVTSKPIEFVTYGKNRFETVSPISDDVLKEVRDAIEQNPNIEQVEVQGHTDDSGNEQFNLNLSQKRADTVRDWLIAAGVPAQKLVAKGYGFEKPLADNRIRTGRQKNRRVQFIIIKQK